MTPQEIVQKFVARHLMLVHNDSGVQRFELYHASGDVSERLQMFPVITGETTSDDLGTDICDVAIQDRNSRNVATPERYGLAAYLDGDEQPVGTCSFTLEGSKSMSTVAAFEETEPPNVKGITGQLMRHNETMMKTMLGMTDVMTGRIISENRALREELARRDSREDKIRSMQEELLDNRDAQELAKAKELSKTKHLDRLGGMLVSMAPMILAQVFGGKKGSPAVAGSALEQGLKGFLANLDQKEIEGIFGALSMPNQMALMELYKNFQTEEKKEDAERPLILRACEGAA